MGTGSGRAALWETCSTIAAACLDSFRTDGSLRSIAFCFLDKRDESTVFRRAFYQQQLIRELRGLPVGGSDQRALAAALGSLNSRLLAPDANADEIKQVVKYAIERSPEAVKLYIVESYGSGAVAVGDGAKASMCGTVLPRGCARLDTQASARAERRQCAVTRALQSARE